MDGSRKHRILRGFGKYQAPSLVERCRIAAGTITLQLVGSQFKGLSTGKNRFDKLRGEKRQQ